MSDLVDYISEEDGQIIIDKGIIGKEIQSDYYIFVKGKVLDVGNSSGDPYIVIESKEKVYRVHSGSLRFFEIID